MGTGKLIVIEGACDGVGKTTQFKMLKEHLKESKIRFADHHFPTYYAYQGKGAEKYLAGEFGEPNEQSPYFINNLFAYDRAITWRVKLASEFEKGKIVLLDRYTTSSMIYQAALFSDLAEKKVFLDYVDDFEYDKLGVRRPDQVLFLTAPFDEAAKLCSKRGINEALGVDIHERDTEYLRRAYDNAQFVANHFDWVKVECTGSDGKMLSPEEVHQKIWQILDLEVSD